MTGLRTSLSGAVEKVGEVSDIFSRLLRRPIHCGSAHQIFVAEASPAGTSGIMLLGNDNANPDGPDENGGIPVMTPLS